MPQYVRDLVGSFLILLFISFGYRELKIGGEYMVNVFNGFIICMIWIIDKYKL